MLGQGSGRLSAYFAYTTGAVVSGTSTVNGVGTNAYVDLDLTFTDDPGGVETIVASLTIDETDERTEGILIINGFLVPAQQWLDASTVVP